MLAPVPCFPASITARAGDRSHQSALAYSRHVTSASYIEMIDFHNTEKYYLEMMIQVTNSNTNYEMQYNKVVL